MLENCKAEDIDYTKPIIVKWWQYNGVYRINKYELIDGYVHWFYLSECNDINIPELKELKPLLTHIKDNLYWRKYSITEGNKEDLEYMLNHPLNVGILTNNFDTHTYD